MRNENSKYFPSFDLSPVQHLKHLQHLMMTPQMKQALSILQLPVLELSSIISEELEQNPVLEYEEEAIEADYEADEEIAHLKKLEAEFYDPFDDRKNYSQLDPEDNDKNSSFIENAHSYDLSLFAFLMNQAKECFDSIEELSIAEWLIGNLDDFGFLSSSIEELASLKNFSVELTTGILQIIQTFDPIGIGARNLQECLLIQLSAKKKRSSLAYRIISEFYDAMIHNKIAVISQSLKLSPQSIKETIEKEISNLDMHPGLNFQYSTACLQTITPDVYIENGLKDLNIKINEESIPALKINTRYLRLLENKDLTTETKQYILNKITAGKWLLKSIEQRHSTLYRIAKEVAEKQADFIFLPHGQLKPFAMKEIAEKLMLNESTVARAISNKYVECPKGIFSLRSFFTNGFTTTEGVSVSSTSVRELIKKIILDEDKSSPLSDEAISLVIKNKGIDCARRTVAKYRKELRLGNASQRKFC